MARRPSRRARLRKTSDPIGRDRLRFLSWSPAGPLILGASGAGSDLLQGLFCFPALYVLTQLVADLLILGASARAAAYSALRAGSTPIAIDRFADRDLSFHATTLRIPADDYPEGLVQIAAATAACPWIYTGALENRPDLIGRLSQMRPLWGNGPEVLRAVRSADRALAESLRSAGLPAVESTLDASAVPRDGSWLRKPLASAGGYGIVPFGPSSPLLRASYYQRQIDGESLSAVFVGTRTGASLLGLTRQLLGRPASPFAYRGSIAPGLVSVGILTRIQDIGEFVARRFHIGSVCSASTLVSNDENSVADRSQSAHIRLRSRPSNTRLDERYSGSIGRPARDLRYQPNGASRDPVLWVRRSSSRTERAASTSPKRPFPSATYSRSPGSPTSPLLEASSGRESRS